LKTGPLLLQAWWLVLMITTEMLETVVPRPLLVWALRLAFKRPLDSSLFYRPVCSALKKDKSGLKNPGPTRTRPRAVCLTIDVIHHC